ncbi:MAG: metallophosphoesterase family protein [Acidobacteriota bacterium]
MIWFTGDTHFGHANIVGYCSRPFADVHEMDREMIARWRTRVKPGDEVYHLGDFALMSPAREEALLAGLPGRKHLIHGNHDTRIGRCRRMDWEWVESYHELELDGHLVVLNHYPIPLEEWEGYWDGSLHLHGHSHGTRPAPDIRRLDVGVDPRGFAPISWPEVKMVLLAVPAPPKPSRPYEGVGK